MRLRDPRRGGNVISNAIAVHYRDRRDFVAREPAPKWCSPVPRGTAISSMAPAEQLRRWLSEAGQGYPKNKTHSARALCVLLLFPVPQQLPGLVTHPETVPDKMIVGAAASTPCFVSSVTQISRKPE